MALGSDAQVGYCMSDLLSFTNSNAMGSVVEFRETLVVLASLTSEMAPVMTVPRTV